MRVKVQIAAPIGPLEHVPKERGDVVNIELRIVVAVGDQQELRQRKLSLAEDGARLREQFLRRRSFEKRRVPLAADGQQQRMHPGGIDGVHGMDARQHCRESSGP